ncbi:MULTISPECIES: DUF5707 domain-containing protein [unclassified Streptomyces]|uniref:DUF5707 domain-containing protein n=1 Tax=unclassified Streptomyces TaxID=2593676 RepID=UPI002DDBD10B|nr:MULTISPECIES: DUF5707 domain-containing protein [unclassified Streptomyces]WSA95936.1 DUF5707 domain-containing protein [Streptomyces sp. NBC_01795]WSB80351.1 DUF5707 domain-containing protein [Streptomyces sp. NBC_01775]WSS11438.1 DUF5707 domain-containing protein [Streptomyces sp. NBC_01186]WSS40152.1 DUF5707 domain-containing protein [Streptomyces sp. NBC_01187]
MSKRVVVSSVIGAVAVGGIAIGGVAVATSPAELTVDNSSARYTAPTSEAEGSLTFTAEVTDDSGARGLKVLAWPKSSDLKPKEKEMADAENATCKKSSEETYKCSYVLKVTSKDAAELAKGTWHVSALAKAKDGDTVFVPKAASFKVTR